MKLTAVLVALLFVAAFLTSLAGQAQPTRATHRIEGFQGATHLGMTPPDWRNPILVIDALGVTFVERRGSPHRWVPASEIETLEGVFSALPAAAWPQGRTVFVESPEGYGVAAGKSVRKNTRLVTSILTRMHISGISMSVSTGC